MRYLWRAVQQTESHPLNGVLQQKYYKGQSQRHQQRPVQAQMKGFFVACAIRLCGKPAGTHPQKPQAHIQHIKNGRAQRHRTHVNHAVGFQMPHQRIVSHSEQRHGQVADNIGNRQPEDVTV